MKFNNPVFIGSIKTKDLILYFDTKRKDVPSYHYYCQFYNSLNDDGSYFDLRQSLIKDLGEPETTYERSDQNSTQWNKDGLKISITYSYDSPFFWDRGFTSFNVFNDLIQNISFSTEELESLNAIDEIISFKKKVYVNSDFRQFNSIRRFPEILEKESGCGFIWVDKNKERIGFASGDYCVFLELSQIAKFSIQNVTPAKGQGSSSLSVELKDNSKMFLMSGDCYYFDKYTVEITRLSGKEIKFEQEYADM